METKENKSFKGKVAFITGGGTGIGVATAVAFAKEGASVVIVGSSDKHLEEAINRIKQEGEEAIAIKCDVRRAEEVKAALDQTIETYGRLDYACNNAGVDHGPELLADVAEDEWDRIVDTNLRGVFLCMKYEIPLHSQAGRRDCQHRVGCRGQRLSGSRLRRLETRCSRADAVGGAGIRRAEHPHQRGVPRHHRHPNDGTRHRRHRTRSPESHRAGADWQDG